MEFKIIEETQSILNKNLILLGKIFIVIVIIAFVIALIFRHLEMDTMNSKFGMFGAIAIVVVVIMGVLIMKNVATNTVGEVKHYVEAIEWENDDFSCER